MLGPEGDGDSVLRLGQALKAAGRGLGVVTGDLSGCVRSLVPAGWSGDSADRWCSDWEGNAARAGQLAAACQHAGQALVDLGTALNEANQQAGRAQPAVAGGVASRLAGPGPADPKAGKLLAQAADRARQARVAARGKLAGIAVPRFGPPLTVSQVTAWGQRLASPPRPWYERLLGGLVDNAAAYDLGLSRFGEWLGKGAGDLIGAGPAYGDPSITQTYAGVWHQTGDLYNGLVGDFLFGGLKGFGAYLGSGLEGLPVLFGTRGFPAALQGWRGQYDVAHDLAQNVVVSSDPLVLAAHPEIASRDAAFAQGLVGWGEAKQYAKTHPYRVVGYELGNIVSLLLPAGKVLKAGTAAADAAGAGRAGAEAADAAQAGDATGLASAGKAAGAAKAADMPAWTKVPALRRAMGTFAEEAHGLLPADKLVSLTEEVNRLAEQGYFNRMPEQQIVNLLHQRAALADVAGAAAGPNAGEAGAGAADAGKALTAPKAAADAANGVPNRGAKRLAELKEQYDEWRGGQGAALRDRAVADALREFDVANQSEIMGDLRREYELPRDHFSPFVNEVARRMLESFKAQVAKNPGQKFVFNGRDGTVLGHAIEQRDPEFFNEHCVHLTVSRKLGEVALQDAEGKSGSSLLDRPFRWHGANPADAVDASIRMRRYLQGAGVPIGRPGSVVTIVDSSFKGTVQEMLAALFPDTEFRGAYIWHGAHPLDPHPDTKLGFVQHLSADRDPSDRGRIWETLAYEDSLQGPLSSPSRFGPDGLPEQHWNYLDGHSLTHLNPVRVAERYKDGKFRDMVQYLNQRAVGDYVHWIARLSKQDAQVALRNGFATFRSEVWNWWRGDGYVHPDFRQRLDSFVWGPDRDEVALLEEYISDHHLDQEQALPLWRELDRLPNLAAKRAFVEGLRRG